MTARLCQIPENNTWCHSKQPPGNSLHLSAGNALNAPIYCGQFFLSHNRHFHILGSPKREFLFLSKSNKKSNTKGGYANVVTSKFSQWRNRLGPGVTGFATGGRSASKKESDRGFTGSPVEGVNTG